MNKEILHIDYELIEDVKALLEFNKDVKCNEELKKKIYEANPGDLVRVKKSIVHKIEIVSVDEVNEEMIKKQIW